MAKGDTRCVFIDANILLSFYDFTDDDLVQLENLVARAREAHVEVVMPDNIVSEYYRNRDKKIADSIKTMRSAQVPMSLPRIAQGYEEFDQYLKLSKELSSKRSQLIEKLTLDAQAVKLKADGIIEDLIDTATIIDCTEDLIDAARDRRDLHKSPGKPDSLGDQLAWEALLDRVPKGDLFVVSRDRDWASSLQPEVIRNELTAEWESKKEGRIKLFPSLRQFLSEVDIGIKLAEDRERRNLVDALFNSGSFTTTHRVVSQLEALDSFTDEEAEILIDALISNTQVEWVSMDSDVRNFYYKIISEFSDVIDKEKRIKAMNIIEFDQLSHARSLTLDDLLDSEGT